MEKKIEMPKHGDIVVFSEEKLKTLSPDSRLHEEETSREVKEIHHNGFYFTLEVGDYITLNEREFCVVNKPRKKHVKSSNSWIRNIIQAANKNYEIVLIRSSDENYVIVKEGELFSSFLFCKSYQQSYDDDKAGCYEYSCRPLSLNVTPLEMVRAAYLQEEDIHY